MKVLHVITGLKNGGAEAVLYRLCTNKNTKNCDQIIISLMDEGKYGPLLRKSGFPVYCLKMPRGRVTIKSIVSLVKILRIYNPDIIQTWMYHADLIGGLVARIIGFNSVFWGVHNIALDSMRAKKSTIFVKNLCNLFSRIIPKHIIFSSGYAANHHKDLGYPSDKFHIIHNGVDLKFFSPNVVAGRAIRTKLQVPSAIPLLGMVARFDPYKDHQSLLEALKVIKKRGQVFRCLLAGDEIIKENKELMISLEKNGIKDWVFLMGPRDDINNIMNALDILILPKYK
jgi:Glycosyltransferase